MKYFLSAVMATGWLCLAMAAFAQSDATPPAAATPAPAASPAPAAAPDKSGSGGGGKRAECVTAVQGKTGQDKQDQFQLCIAQARVDCLKQAIDQKVVGPARRDAIKSCMREE
jgi:hypothetical protein